MRPPNPSRQPQALAQPRTGLSLCTAGKLFGVGFTIGPLVDSLHNQCLLRYDYAPIYIPFPSASAFATGGTEWGVVSSSISISTDPLPVTVAAAVASIEGSGGGAGGSEWLLATSWAVPPLLGVAYVVLGGVLPRLLQWLLHDRRKSQRTGHSNNDDGMTIPTTSSGTTTTTTKVSSENLQLRAILAVFTTAAIIKLSAFLELHPTFVTDSLGDYIDFLDHSSYRINTMGSSSSILVDVSTTVSRADVVLLALVALGQWALLDGTLVALCVATMAAFGGPLSELPFVAAGFWHYLPTAGDYMPLQGFQMEATATTATTTLGSSPSSIVQFCNQLLQVGLGPDYASLAISSITGPCYFAVTMDAIAIGRWFDSQEGDLTYD